MADDRTIVIPVEVTMNAPVTDNSPITDPIPDDSPATEEQQEAATKAKSKKNPAVALVSQMAKKTATTALNNYGNLTGDYITQQNIQTAISETTELVSALALGVPGVTMYGFNKAIEGYNYMANLKRSRREAKFRQERVGFTSDRA